MPMVVVRTVEGHYVTLDVRDKGDGVLTITTGRGSVREVVAIKRDDVQEFVRQVDAALTGRR